MANEWRRVAMGFDRQLATEHNFADGAPRHNARASEFLLGCRASAKRRGGRTGSRRRRGGQISALVAAEIGARRPRV